MLTTDAAGDCRRKMGFLEHGPAAPITDGQQKLALDLTCLQVLSFGSRFSGRAKGAELSSLVDGEDGMEVKA